MSRIESIKSLLVAEGINFYDTGRAIESLRETVMPRHNVACYLTALTEEDLDIVQRADGIQYACINEEAVFFRAHRSGTWVRTSVKPELEYFTPAGRERITDVDTSAPIYTGHNLAEISAYFKG